MSGTPDYDYWDQFAEYPLHVAAFLCCDLEPPENADSLATLAKLPNVMQMQADLKAYGLGTVGYAPGIITINHDGKPRVLRFNKEAKFTIRRDRLRKWAEEMGFRKRMPFLFPEDRTDKAPGPRTVRTLYAVIRALTKGLAHAKTEVLKRNGKVILGDENSGVVGYLMGNGFTELKPTALQDHIRIALKGD